MKLEDTMHFLWNKYLETKDMGKEIATILRNYKK